MPVTVKNLEVERFEVDYTPEVVAALQAIKPGLRGLPLARERFSLELGGVHVAVANSLRRALIEMPGRALKCPALTLQPTSDDHMSSLERFVEERIELLPLIPHVPASVAERLEFALDVANDGAEVRTVYSGDLVASGVKKPPALFNPTTPLAVLQPGRSIRITGIRVAEGRGGAYQRVGRAASVPLDLERHPAAETHTPHGKHRTESGYVESPFVANPRRFRVAGDLAAVAAAAGGKDPAQNARAVVADACAHVVDRLKSIRADIADDKGLLESVQLDRMVKTTLTVAGENETVGELLARTVHELEPDLGFVKGEVIPHEGTMQLIVSDSKMPADELASLVERAVATAAATFAEIAAAVRGA